MGQRLTVTIRREKDGKALACGYWHWSGYTPSAQNVLDNVVTALVQETFHLDDGVNNMATPDGPSALNNSRDVDVLYAYNALTRYTSAALDVNEVPYFFRKYLYKPDTCKDSSSGEVSIAEPDKLEAAGENPVTIFLYDKDEYSINFWGCVNCWDEDEVHSDLKDYEIIDADYDVGKLSLEELDDLCDDICGKNVVLHLKDGSYISSFE